MSTTSIILLKFGLKIHQVLQQTFCLLLQIFDLIQGLSTFWRLRTPKTKLVPKLCPLNKTTETAPFFIYFPLSC